MLNIELPYDPQVLLLGRTTQEKCKHGHTKVCTHMFIRALFNWVVGPKCPPVDEWINKMLPVAIQGNII